MIYTYTSSRFVRLTKVPLPKYLKFEQAIMVLKIYVNAKSMYMYDSKNNQL